MKTILWIHADSLSPYHPIFTQAPGSPAIFVWDDALLAEWQISFKRIVFIYECLLELPVSIYRGDVAVEVAAFARQHATERILTPASPSPRHRVICNVLRQQLPELRFEVVKDQPLAPVSSHLDLQRFSRYWRQIRRKALKL